MVPMLNVTFSCFAGVIDVQYSIGGDWFRRGRNRVVVPLRGGQVVGARIWIGKERKITRLEGPALEMDDGHKRWQRLDDQGNRI